MDVTSIMNKKLAERKTKPENQYEIPTHFKIEAINKPPNSRTTQRPPFFITHDDAKINSYLFLVSDRITHECTKARTSIYPLTPNLKTHTTKGKIIRNLIPSAKKLQ